MGRGIRDRHLIYPLVKSGQTPRPPIRGQAIKWDYRRQAFILHAGSTPLS